MVEALGYKPEGQHVTESFNSPIPSSRKSLKI
jgi:hypothetical protein